MELRYATAHLFAATTRYTDRDPSSPDYWGRVSYAKPIQMGKDEAQAFFSLILLIFH